MNNKIWGIIDSESSSDSSDSSSTNDSEHPMSTTKARKVIQKRKFQSDAWTQKANHWWSGGVVMLDDTDTSDFKIIVGSTQFTVHKVILGFKSNVFRAMFQSQMQEHTTNELVVTDFSSDIVGSMIMCIYDPHRLINATEEHGLFPMFAIADKYGIDSMVELLVLQMGESITIDTLVDTILLAHEHNQPYLKNTVFYFILKKKEEVFAIPQLSEKLGFVLCDELFQFIASKMTARYT